MAKAETKNKTVKKMVEVEVDEPVVVLTLTMQEACALRLLTGCVGGTPDGTIREFTDGIFNSLLPIVKAPYSHHSRCVYANVSLMPNLDNFLIANEISSKAKEEILKLYPMN